jgi:hypothetical protein
VEEERVETRSGGALLASPFPGLCFTPAAKGFQTCKPRHAGAAFVSGIWLYSALPIYSAKNFHFFT